MLLRGNVLKSETVNLKMKGRNPYGTVMGEAVSQKETDQLVYNFNASITFDKRFYKQDIKGSLAHVAMLAKQGILTEEEKEQITDGLNGILADVESGKLEISDKYEDIHSFVEATLIDRIGDPGKKLHTGRSRNDQVALDMKLFTRDEIHEIDAQVKELLEVILHVMEENVETYMPGFTHLPESAADHTGPPHGSIF